MYDVYVSLYIYNIYRWNAYCFLYTEQMVRQFRVGMYERERKHKNMYRYARMHLILRINIHKMYGYVIITRLSSMRLLTCYGRSDQWWGEEKRKIRANASSNFVTATVLVSCFGDIRSSQIARRKSISSYVCVLL